MKELQTKHFAKWASKQDISSEDLSTALQEVADGNVDADHGGHLFKKRIRFDGQGKSGSGRTIICYQRGAIAIFIHGFAKNEKSSLSKNELKLLKALAKAYIAMSDEDIQNAIDSGKIKEV